jgi:DNA-binding response OmpR family regulator
MKGSYTSVLLVEDDKNLGLVLKGFLELEGFEVKLVNDGLKAWSAFEEGIFDLCIVDVMMPFKDGFSLVQDIRKKDQLIPVIFLTARKMDEDRIRGFKVGGDDYVTKPFSTEELLLRIRAILKRTNPKTTDAVDCAHQIGKYFFDFENQLLEYDDRKRHITRREADVLRMLCVYKNKVIRREVLLKKIWGTDDYFAGRSLDVYITKLRKLLKEDKGLALTNIHGMGYKLEVKE